MQPEDFAGQPDAPPAEMLAGRYRLSTRLLGRGGLADVWAGVDEMLGRPVAVKIFRPGTETADDQRFCREARTLAGLSHPHLISLYDAGEAQGRAYLVMSQVPGGTLAAELRAIGSLPAETVRRMGAQVASALAYIHDRGIVHRDVKPANILLDNSGAAVLADFGIARLVDGTRLTSAGLTVGTAAYLSPEQVRGRQVGPPADVYALGLVLLESLTGRREYPGDPVEAAVARLYRAPSVPERLPYGLTGLLRRMTADDPASRPSASAVYGALGRAVAAVPSQIRAVAGASPADPTKPVLIPVRRRRRALWLTPAAIVIGATATAIALNAQGSPDAADASTHAPARTAPTAPANHSAIATPSTRSAAGHASAAATSRAPLPSLAASHEVQRATVAVSVSAPRPAVPPAPPATKPGHGKGHGAGHGHGHGKGSGHSNGHNQHR